MHISCSRGDYANARDTPGLTTVKRFSFDIAVIILTGANAGMGDVVSS